MITDENPWWDWRRRWDRQQEVYLPYREQRFDVMLDIAAQLLPADAVVVDLCCGLGSLTERALPRLPTARLIAVDLDPVLLRVGQQTIGTAHGRVEWIQADLTAADWTSRLPVDRVDAVLSTTALHYLPAEQLVRLYRQLFGLLAPGGFVANGDHMAYPARLPTFRTLAETTGSRWYEQSMAAPEAENFGDWWRAIAEEPGMAELMVERERLFAWRDHREASAEYVLQRAAMEEAGFHEVDTVWQHLDNRVLLAHRGAD